MSPAGLIFPEQVNIKNRSNGGEDQTRKGIAQVQVGDCDKIGDNHQFVRNHHQCKEKSEHEILSSKLQSCKCKGGKCNNHQHKHCGDNSENKSVQEITAERDGCECLVIVLQGWRQCKEFRYIFPVIGAVALQG